MHVSPWSRVSRSSRVSPWSTNGAGFQNAGLGPDQRFHAVAPYSLRSPPKNADGTTGAADPLPDPSGDQHRPPTANAQNADAAS